VAQKFHFAILQIKVTCASRGLSAIRELLVKTYIKSPCTLLYLRVGSFRRKSLYVYDIFKLIIGSGYEYG